MFHTSQIIPLSQITELNFAFSQITDFKKGQSHVTENGPAPPPSTMLNTEIVEKGLKTKMLCLYTEITNFANFYLTGIPSCYAMLSSI